MQVLAAKYAVCIFLVEERQMDRVSDRERAQLRGLVKTVVDGQTRTEFDRDGKLLSVSRRNPDGSEYGDSYTYDDQGRLHLIVSRDWDGRPHEKIYSYGETGWLLKITDSRGEL